MVQAWSILAVVCLMAAHTSGDQATLRAAAAGAASGASPGLQMVGLLKDVRRALSGEREEADKVIVDRQTQCKKQEDALTHSLKQYQQVLNDLAMDQDHKSVAMGTLKRAVENNRDLTRHLQEEQDAVKVAEDDDLDSFALATLVRETAAGANREHVNRNRMYAKTTTDLLSIVQRHFTGVPEERNFGAHDIVRVSSVDSGAEKPASMLETESKNATSAGAAVVAATANATAKGQGPIPSALGVPIEAFQWRDAEAHAIYSRLQDLLRHVSTGMDKENAVEFKAVDAFKNFKGKRNVDRMKRVAMNRTVGVDMNAAKEEDIKSKIDLDMAIARDEARPTKVAEATDSVESLKAMIKLTRKTCEDQESQDSISAQLRSKQLSLATDAMATVQASVKSVKDLVAKYKPTA